MKTKIFLLSVVLAVGVFNTAFAQLTILSGPEQASYYRFVNDMDMALTQEGAESIIINKQTSGSAENYSMLVDPDSPYKVAMIQEDYLYFMKGLDSRMNTEKSDAIKVLLPLAWEEIHLVTLKKNGLTKLQDLQKKIVAIGTKNQGTYATASLIKDRSRVQWSSRNIHFDKALNDLFMGEIDAFFIVGTAPIEKLNINPRALTEDLALIELNDFNDWAKYYKNDTIHKEDYLWLDKDIPTFGVRTLLVVNENKLSDADKMLVKQLVDGLQKNLPVLKEKGHPKWKDVDLNDWNPADWPVYDTGSMDE